MSKVNFFIDFHDRGIANLLSQFSLMVPASQRPYKWDEDRVRQLFEDFSSAFSSKEQAYFLGTIVFTKGESNSNRLLVADGQQRLATTAILIAAIRDYLYGIGKAAKKAGEVYESTYLLTYDPRTEVYAPKLKLNVEDNEYFVTSILEPPSDARDATRRGAASTSNIRLARAADIAKEHTDNILRQFTPSERARKLYDWIDFLENDVRVIAITVPKEVDAYTMFETLNDRGLHASQIDILKNFFYQSAAKDDRQDEVITRWASMVGMIESQGDEELMLDFVRHYWISQNGPTTEKELAVKIKAAIASSSDAVSTAIQLDEHASDYIALLNPLDSPRFDEFGKNAREYVLAITRLLKVKQIRPLLLAIMRSFEPVEANRAFRLCLSWSVRFLVTGGGGGGTLERNYGILAQAVTDGEARTTKELANRFKLVPSNAQFAEAFRRHTVARADIARYYLHSLERAFAGDPEPQIGFYENPELTTNLEHILPLRALAPDWNIPADEAQALYNRLGNMALLTSRINAKLGRQGFDAKKPLYAQSAFVLTQQVAEFDRWDRETIVSRQEKMAEYAAKTWPI